MKVLETIRRQMLTARGDTVAVAVSGGSDSMAVLHALLGAREALGIRVAACNFEHGIRGEASRADTAFVKAYCEAQGIPCYASSGDVPGLAAARGMGIEEAAREARYAFFHSLLERGVCSKVAVCHNADDNAETVFMHLARGAGRNGACGMSYACGGIIRPLLDTTKREVRAYVRAHGVPYREDATNADAAYDRNFLRLRVFPQIAERYPGFPQALTRFAAFCAEDEDFLRAEAKRKLQETPFGYALPLDLPAPLLKRGVAEAHRRLGGRDLTSERLDACARLAENGVAGKELELPHGISVFRDYGVLSVERGGVPQRIEERAFEAGTYRLGGYSVTVEETEGYCPQPGALIAGNVPPGAVWRARRAGDRFRPFGGGDRALDKYLSDRKVPKRFRDGLPILAAGSRALLVAGIEVSAELRAGAGRAYRITVKNTDEKRRPED